ncbi:TRAFAC clade GTPase domain-containing protein [Avibacterium paragallinarum]|uniref:Ribonucleoside-triphosphate reductase n=2 Tax=Avibacterium paragallinarum TaxID=728 RepID=A0ABU7QFJ1_AVIPA|nr:ribonucleoside-triphosphate reductase [Avibacterium paragallinarum]MEE3608362.1 ribonucleoside-triphosphate reductase [Avibacterium paragallinarum]MEE3622217.1 ribonucleoside-triphosphate reductase [Avibacterium paragallinarum]MEE3669722.1 ribonucleoside-triphosphate reductase [Avibacterium paragallinarum]MEE3680055.1 ribonucleoside-triphosphate reductase [Avibacterium paragallinarum]MEE4385154.1 ribonucleoside-triphosphate reductase [Avibacterium paragallinarum]
MMLHNPFSKKDNNHDELSDIGLETEQKSETNFGDTFSLEENNKITTEENDFSFNDPPLFSESPLFTQEQSERKDSYKSKMDVNRSFKRNLDLNDEQYHQRLLELNTDAENKHYVLFFGQPASGKTWIIGSLLHYMKNCLQGTVYLDTQKATTGEEELFYQLQDRFNGVTYAEKLTSTDQTQYFEYHISFTPKDPNKPKINFVFVDASGEHSEKGFFRSNKDNSGALPNYLTAILESDVQTKLVFVYDQSLKDLKGAIPQMNVLNAVFTHIQHIQNHHNKFFPKALLLSKADRIYANDYSSVERNGYDPMLYAIDKIPAFANSFFNESEENKTIFYKMGKFSTNSDLLLEFDKECPERLFKWLYMSGTGGISPIQELTCWQKFLAWFKGK